jgi:Uma2 family endonuclease
MFDDSLKMSEMGDAQGVRLEITDGLPTWEAFPNIRHQRKTDQIRASIRPTPGENTDCACVHYADIYVKFPDGSLKRPDIAIFCREPKEETEAVTMLPEAIIEILSVGYEEKDLAVSVPFYLRMQIKDILVFDPETGLIRHFRPGHSEQQYQTPKTLVLTCGCEVTL